MKSIYTFEVAKKYIALAKEQLEIDLEGEVQTISAHEIGHDEVSKHGAFLVAMIFHKDQVIRVNNNAEILRVYFKTNQIEFWIRCDRIHNIRLLETDKIFNLK
jgi:hypothetical protein